MHAPGRIDEQRIAEAAGNGLRNGSAETSIVRPAMHRVTWRRLIPVRYGEHPRIRGHEPELQQARDRRLDHAAKLLLGSPRNGTEVAFDSGFEDTSPFSRVFKERFGVPPLAYRRNPSVAV
jgi:hypothetical protein